MLKGTRSIAVLCLGLTALVLGQGCALEDPDQLYLAAQHAERDALFPEAVFYYRHAAMMGHTGAQLRLGGILATGRIEDASGHVRATVDADPVEAEQWFRKAVASYQAAAEQGDVEAQSRLGWMYYVGWGVERDAEEAFAWWRRASEQGYAEAQYALGWLKYWQEDNDPEAAISVLKAAAEQGHAPAQMLMAKAYQDGYGVAQDFEESLQWTYRAATNGSSGSDAPHDALLLSHTQGQRLVAEQVALNVE
jgi:TPR repeat protein